MKPVEDALLELVQSTLDIAPLNINPAWNKWEARSGLQKCIRRGLEGQALSCAFRLSQIEPSYLWRSLNIIALEDVGPGAADAVTWTRQIMANQSLSFSKATATDSLKALIAYMCRAPKSRACCEMSIGMDWSDGGKALLKEAETWSPEDLTAAVFGVSFCKSYAALAHISNRLPKGFGRNLSSAATKGLVLTDMRELNLSSTALEVAAVVMTDKPTDSMGVSLWPLAMMLEGTEEPKTVADDLGETHEIKGLPAATWDMHVSTGKIALKAFYTSLCKVYPEIKAIPEFGASKALGAVVFVEEGGLVDRRMVSPFLKDLKDWQDRTLCLTYGVPEDLYLPLREIVRKEMPRLNSKREWVQKTFAD